MKCKQLYLSLCIPLFLGMFDFDIYKHLHQIGSFVKKEDIDITEVQISAEFRRKLNSHTGCNMTAQIYKHSYLSDWKKKEEEIIQKYRLAVLQIRQERPKDFEE